MDTVLFQGSRKRINIDDGTSGSVHDEAVSLHQREELSTDETLGLFCQ